MLSRGILYGGYCPTGILSWGDIARGDIGEGCCLGDTGGGYGGEYCPGGDYVPMPVWRLQ